MDMTTSPKTILITGCAGFIGNNFAKEFKKQFPKTKIIGLDDFSSGRRDSIEKWMIFYEGSICDELLLEKIFKKHKPEYVFHFAAIPRIPYSIENPIETSEVNIMGTVKLLNSSRKHKVKRFIFSSSSSVYGNAKKMPTRESENEPRPESPYAVQKNSCEKFCASYSKLYGLDTVSLRYFTVFGPGQYGNSPYATVICAWLESLYFNKKNKPVLQGNETQTRDFCYVDNVVQANILAMKSKTNLGGEVYNIANGNRISLLEVKKILEKKLGINILLEKKPRRLGSTIHTHAHIGKAKKHLNYVPIVSFTDGLQKTINWFEDRKKSSSK